ncbi:MAG: hypothetical protein JKY65_12820 [Planctomycetes bacterium]|nr:hypothetical protein [Planctomycetota bacterium]
MSELRAVFLTLDGVTYRYGHRDAIQTRLETDVPPSAETALELAKGALVALDGDDLQLKAGWLGIRWLSTEETAWDGPAFLFSFEASEPGQFAVTANGQDDADWPLPG